MVISWNRREIVAQTITFLFRQKASQRLPFLDTVDSADLYCNANTTTNAAYLLGSCTSLRQGFVITYMDCRRLPKSFPRIRNWLTAHVPYSFLSFHAFPQDASGFDSPLAPQRRMEITIMQNQATTIWHGFVCAKIGRMFQPHEWQDTLARSKCCLVEPSPTQTPAIELARTGRQAFSLEQGRFRVLHQRCFLKSFSLFLHISFLCCLAFAFFCLWGPPASPGRSL